MAEDQSVEYFLRLVNKEALVAYLASELSPADDFHVERHLAGHSNETLFVTWNEREMVLRRPPPGETADTAHDVLREYRVIDALQDTPVRVPTTVLACDDHDVIGSDFYLMERLEGDVLRAEEPERFGTTEHRERVGTELVDGLAEVHQVDYEAVGLDEFGYPDGYTERQVDRWGKQYAWAMEVTEEEREVPVVHEVAEWLEDNIPEEYPHTLVHGDYKLDNVMFGPGTPPELVAIFDWEMSTLGDPRVDLGWMLSFWHDEENPGSDLAKFESSIMTAEGYLTRRELVDRYEEQTGIDFEHERFYRALAVYKIGALGEMFFRRYLEGNSDDPTYPAMRNRVPALAERAKSIIEAENPL